MIPGRKLSDASLFNTSYKPVSGVHRAPVRASALVTLYNRKYPDGVSLSAVYPDKVYASRARRFSMAFFPAGVLLKYSILNKAFNIQFIQMSKLISGSAYTFRK